MRYIFYGAGAIGGSVGHRLHSGGHDVVLIARGAQLEALRTHGLTLRIAGRADDTQPVPVVAHPREVEFQPDDVVMLSTKTQDTEAALTELEAWAPPDVAVFCAQNGVENERLAARRFERVYGVHVFMPATFIEPGVVECYSWPRIGAFDAGRYPDGADETLRAVAADLEASGVACRPRDDIMRWKYTKLVGVLHNTLEAVCGTSADLRELGADLRREGNAVLDAAGISHVGTDEMAAMTSGVMTPVAAREGASAWQSLVRGTGTSEADYINGEIAMLGRLHGCPAPLNEAVRRLANQAARERWAPGRWTPSQVRELAAEIDARSAVARR